MFFLYCDFIQQLKNIKFIVVFLDFTKTKNTFFTRIKDFNKVLLKNELHVVCYLMLTCQFQHILYFFSRFSRLMNLFELRKTSFLTKNKIITIPVQKNNFTNNFDSFNMVNNEILFFWEKRHFQRNLKIILRFFDSRFLIFFN